MATKDFVLYHSRLPWPPAHVLYAENARCLTQTNPCGNIKLRRHWGASALPFIYLTQMSQPRMVPIQKKNEHRVTTVNRNEI